MHLYINSSNALFASNHMLLLTQVENDAPTQR